MAATKRRRLQGGAILIDGLLGIFTVALGAMAFFSLAPTVQRSQEMAGSEDRAVQIAARYIEHIQLLKARDITFGTLSQLNLLDANQNPNSQPYTFTDLPMDDGARYSPSKALHHGTGRVSWEDLEAGSVRVTVEVRWKSESGRTRRVRTGTIIGGYR